MKKGKCRRKEEERKMVAVDPDDWWYDVLGGALNSAPSWFV